MDGIRQHKAMAAGEGPSGNFGVEPFHKVNGGAPMPDHQPATHEAYGPQSKLLHDHQRAIGRHVSRGPGMMPAQRNPDHGPHFHHDFGVGSIPR